MTIREILRELYNVWRCYYLRLGRHKVSKYDIDTVKGFRTGKLMTHCLRCGGPIILFLKNNKVYMRDLEERDFMP